MSEPTSGAGSPALPTGTLTFFRSDLEGSMALLPALGAEYDTANAEHHAIVRGSIDRYGGQIVRTEGDATFAVFTEAHAGCRAAIEVQRSMAAHPWPVGHASVADPTPEHRRTGRRPGDGSAPLPIHRDREQPRLEA
jgi:class 3 adenylate cyclase